MASADTIKIVVEFTYAIPLLQFTVLTRMKWWSRNALLGSAQDDALRTC